MKDPGLRSTCDTAHIAENYSCVALFQDSSVMFQVYLTNVVIILETFKQSDMSQSLRKSEEVRVMPPA